MSGEPGAGADARLTPPGAGTEAAALFRLGGLGAAATALTVAGPCAFRAGGDNAYMAVAIATGLIAIAANSVAPRAPERSALWMIASVAILLRGYLLVTDPLLSDDIYRYVWDGLVQGAGINPYRHVPADAALAFLRDHAVYPNINRADSAATIYPPVAQAFFFLVTRLSASVAAMKLALLGCEAVTVAMIVLLLRRIARPVTHVVAYAWHPLPLWEIANNGHIDALMVSLMMLGLWLAARGWPLRGGLAVALSVLAKPFGVVALPAIWRPWDWKLPLLVLAVWGLSYLPYLSVGWGVFGFLTTGYFSDERFDTGDSFWPLAAVRSVIGADVVGATAYLGVAAAALAAMALAAAFRAQRSPATLLWDTSRLSVALLFVLSPNHPWYFLVLTPFVALIGGAPLWAFTLGAVVLQDEVEWDPSLPIMLRKSILYGAFLAACGYAAWQRWRVRPEGAAGDDRPIAQ